MTYNPELAKTAGNFEHYLRDCAKCGTVPFYRVYKNEEPLRCTGCNAFEAGPLADDPPALDRCADCGCLGHQAGNQFCIMTSYPLPLPVADTLPALPPVPVVSDAELALHMRIAELDRDNARWCERIKTLEARITSACVTLEGRLPSTTQARVAALEAALGALVAAFIAWRLAKPGDDSDTCYLELWRAVDAARELLRTSAKGGE